MNIPERSIDTVLVLLGTLGPGVTGTLIWLVRGASLYPTLTWTVPLTAALAVAVLLLPSPLSFVIIALGLVAFVVMAVSERAAKWWFIHVLRRTEPWLHGTLEPSDQQFDNDFDEIIRDVERAIAHWRREEETSNVIRLLDRRRDELASLEAPSEEWASLRQLAVDYTTFLLEVCRGDRPADATTGGESAVRMAEIRREWEHVRAIRTVPWRQRSKT